MTKKEAATILARSRSKKKSHSYSANQIAEAASVLGKSSNSSAGGHSRADALTEEQRYEIAAHAANIRWGNSSSYKKTNRS